MPTRETLGDVRWNGIGCATELRSALEAFYRWKLVACESVSVNEQVVCSLPRHKRVMTEVRHSRRSGNSVAMPGAGITRSNINAAGPRNETLLPGGNGLTATFHLPGRSCLFRPSCPPI